MKKFLHKTGTLLYTITIIAVIVIATMLAATVLPIPGNVEVKIVKSGSMEPHIPTGSIVIIKPEKNYAVGEVVTFGRDTKRHIPTTHRIVDITQKGGVQTLTTKGDANQEVDQVQTPVTEVIGKVIFSLPYVGFVLDFARTRAGFVTLIGIPALLVILDELGTIGTELSRMRRARSKRYAKKYVGSTNRVSQNSTEVTPVLPIMPVAQRKLKPQLLEDIIRVPRRRPQQQQVIKISMNDIIPRIASVR